MFSKRRFSVLRSRAASASRRPRRSSPRSSAPICQAAGYPTRDELLADYPAAFTWEQLKTFVNSGDLGLLKRDRKLQQRYNIWAAGIRQEYGSMVNYLQNRRLQWGKPDTLSLLTSSLNVEMNGSAVEDDSVDDVPPPYFTAETPSRYISVIQNDWPYSVPPEIEHVLVWTKVPIYHPDIVPSSIAPRVEQDGLWGFTGNTSPPPSPSNLPSCLPALAEWGITKDKMIVSQKGTEEEEALVRQVGSHVHEYVKKRWNENEWETAWFVNPPRLQSVPGLAHIHVFAKRKTLS
ncbi:hypothetical protein BT96DRAFT_962557 [Gymnopus androsaceus JB14]|uniref:Uncharacterized protein n=1 Tax=Gymnopus androsaceus JB14 TaxID=1447944 RepID=A0A6A4IEC3_9AGAR|nr:hypothetical protein BT96DRAFT_962557 [Gymnopus androsaceus JB14]